MPSSDGAVGIGRDCDAPGVRVRPTVWCSAQTETGAATTRQAIAAATAHGVADRARFGERRSGFRWPRAPAAASAAASNMPMAAAALGRAAGSRLSSAVIGGRRIGGDDRGHRCGGVAAVVVGALPLHGGVQSGAERPQIRGRRGRLTEDSFRCEKGRRSHHHPGLGERGIAIEGRDAEVSQHRPAVAGEQHVGWLHVAVQHTGGMGGR